jgi:hypothetical protein
MPTSTIQDLQQLIRRELDAHLVPLTWNERLEVVGYVAGWAICWIRCEMRRKLPERDLPDQRPGVRSSLVAEAADELARALIERILDEPFENIARAAAQGDA